MSESARLHSMRRQRALAQATWLSFVNAYKPGSGELYAFFEGRDDVAFYLPRLREHIPKTVYPVRCGSKESMIGALPRIRQRLSATCEAAFFVDKDLDDLLGRSANDPLVFETEVYSIDNYVACENVLPIVWDELFHLPRDARFNQFVSSFQQSFKAFCGQLRIVMAFILCARRNGLSCNLKDFDIEDCLDVHWPTNHVKLRGRQHFLSQVTGGVLPRAEIRAAVGELKAHDFSQILRGKFTIAFLVLFINHWQRELAQGALGLDRARVIVPLNKSNAMEVLGPRVRTPDRLARFISSWRDSLTA